MAVQQWYYRKGNARFGPVTGTEIKQLAAAGKLEPTDLLRGVGMSEWIPASKVKGLFAPQPSTPPKQQAKPKVEEELGLAPSPDTPKPEVAKPPPKPAAPVPMPQQPVAPAAPQGFAAVPDASNPFAQFGLEQGPAPTAAPDPFAGAPDFSLPIGDAFAGAGFGEAGPNPFDNLAALGSQGQAIAQQPTSQAAGSDPFTKAKPKSDSPSVGFGPLGTVGLLAAPFVVMAIMGFVCGIFGGFLPRIIIYFIVSGSSKMAGMFAGNCLLKAKIKNEVLSLGYGGLLGIFTAYVFVAGVFWGAFKFNQFLTQPARQSVQVSTQVDEDGRFLGLEPDQPSPFSDPDYVPEPAPVAETKPVVEVKPVAEKKTAPVREDDPFGEVDEDDPFGEKAETKTASVSEDDPFGENEEVAPPKPAVPVAPPKDEIADDEEEAEEEEEEAELTPEQQKELEEFQTQMEDEWEQMSDRFERGISPFGALNPLFLLFILIIAPIFTLINVGLWICITAHSTWTANLGHDPTKNTGF